MTEGLGTLVARLGAGLPVPLATAATAVDWNGEGVTVDTPQGAIRARACIDPDEAPAAMLASVYQIEIAGRRHDALASLTPIYDPESERVKL